MGEKVFISYSRADKNRVFALKKDIEEHVGSGSCWLDISGIESDKEFVDVIIEAINRTDIFLFVYSAESKESSWTKKELQFAEKKHKRIIFVRIDKTPLSEWFEFNYGGHDIVDINVKEQKEKLINNLVGWCRPYPSAVTEQSDGSDEALDKRISPKKKGKRVVWIISVIAGLVILLGIGSLLLYFSNNKPIVRKRVKIEYLEGDRAREARLDRLNRKLKMSSLMISYSIDDRDFSRLSTQILDHTAELDHGRSLLGEEEYTKKYNELKDQLLTKANKEWQSLIEAFEKGLITYSVAKERAEEHVTLLNCIREIIGDTNYDRMLADTQAFSNSLSTQ